MRKNRLIFGIVGLALFAAGCDSTNSKEKLPGQRISVLELEKQLSPDPSLASIAVALPKPEANRDWPQAGGNPDHSMGHPALPDSLTIAWRQSFGDGKSRYGQILASPVVFNGVVYTMDSQSLVSAFDGKAGKQLWETDVTPADDDNQGWGGGVAYDRGRVYVSSGFGQVLALDAATGKEIWRVSTGSPVHAAPTVADNRVFVVTVDNTLLALSADDGHKLWNYDGIPESAQLAGNASPAVEGGVVVAPFSSGEIIALRVENGRSVWSDSLAATRRFDPMSTIADVRGAPVIDRGRVYAVSHSGRMTATDLRTGTRLWEQDIGGTNGPWVAGDFVYVLSSTNELICLMRDDGRVRWIRQLDRWDDPDDKSGPIQWAGPLLAGDRLVLIASTGEAWSISPYTGDVLSRLELPEGSFLAPIAVDGTLYLTTNDADLLALR